MSKGTEYHPRHRVSTRKPPDVSPDCAARRTLRILALTLIQRIDDPNADLKTLSEQCRQTGELALSELADARRVPAGGTQ